MKYASILVALFIMVSVQAQVINLTDVEFDVVGVDNHTVAFAGFDFNVTSSPDNIDYDPNFGLGVVNGFSGQIDSNPPEFLNFRFFESGTTDLKNVELNAFGLNLLFADNFGGPEQVLATFGSLDQFGFEQFISIPLTADPTQVFGTNGELNVLTGGLLTSSLKIEPIAPNAGLPFEETLTNARVSFFDVDDPGNNAVPEPSTYVMILLMGSILGFRHLRQKKKEAAV